MKKFAPCLVFSPVRWVLWLSFMFSVSAAEKAAPQRPNLIIMMVDDLGFSDFGCYGSEIQTPNIDRLAQGGLRFSQFYNTAKCHSSRVSLLTGLYCNQAGSTKLNRGVTIAEVLAKAGYATAMVGKWHLDREPTDRGFQKYFGHLSGATNYFTGDDTFRLNGKPWKEFDKDFYTTDANIRFATRFMDEMLEEDAGRPFFLYVAHNAPHYPLQVKKEDYEKYDGVYQEGWDLLRHRRYQKQLDMGLIPKTWALSPRPDLVPSWKSLSKKDQIAEARKMTAFAGMVDRVDQTTGTLIAYLKEKQILDNTLILICSDNGACPFDRTKGGPYEPWDPRSYWCYDTAWSHLGNTPFRLHKQNQHQGGNSSPLIAYWPKGLKTNPGAITDQPAHLIDFMATAIDLAGATYPESWPGIALEPLEGKSLLPILEGKTRTPHDQLYFQYATNRALREGDWKLVSHRLGKWELYNLREDGTELHDLAGQEPARVTRMAEAWMETAKKKDHLSDKLMQKPGPNPAPRLKKNGTPE